MSDQTSPPPIRLTPNSSRSAGRHIALAPSATPQLGWVIPLVRAGQGQRAFEVRVMEAPIDPRGTGSAFWGSGRVPSDDSANRVIVPRPLAPRTRYLWTVRVWDERGRRSAWADPVPLETGPRPADRWHARWIEVPAGHRARLPLVLDREVASARLYVTAQGLVRAGVRGTVVAPHSILPGRTDRGRALYRAFDITDLLDSGGEATLELDVASGHWASSGSPPRVLAEVRVEYRDGMQAVFGTGSGTLVSTEPWFDEEALYLERRLRDAAGLQYRRLPLPGRPDRGSDEGLPSSIEPDPSPPFEATGRLRGRVVSSAARSFVVDFGENVAGRVSLRLDERPTSATRIRVVHGEVMSAEGHVSTANLTMPHDLGRDRQVFEWSGASRSAVVEPTFAVYGFRFVEVTGVPVSAVSDVDAVVIHTNVRSTSAVDVDDPLLERLLTAGRRTGLNCMLGVPVDCPTREQNAWTGDAGATADLALAQFDMNGFYRRWLDDFRTSQLPDGSLPAIVPGFEPEAVPTDPVWATALHRVMWGHWLHYGDPEVLRSALPTLERWCRRLWAYRGTHGLIDGAPISYGHDWLALEQTQPEILHTAAAVETFRTAARVASAVGSPGAAERYERWAGELTSSLDAMASRAPRLSGRRPSQGLLATMADLGIFGEQGREELSRRLVAAIAAREWRATTGFAATGTLIRVLSDRGLSRIVERILRQPAQPGVGAMLVSGPGTFWESWRIDETNAGTGSLDHIGLGGPFAAWMWRTVVGVRPLEGGYAAFRIDPADLDGVSRWSARIETVHGDVDVAYARSADEVTIGFSVPVGTTARMHTDGGETEFSSGLHEVTRSARPAPERIPPRPEAAVLPPVEEVRSVPRSTGAIEVRREGLECAPVSHQQFGGPVLMIRPDPDQTSRPVVDLVLSRQVDTSGHALLADVDICQWASPAPVYGIVEARDRTGRTARTRQRLWPAGWTTIVLDLDDLGLPSVEEVHVEVVDENGAAISAPWSLGPLRLASKRDEDPFALSAPLPLLPAGT